MDSKINTGYSAGTGYDNAQITASGSNEKVGDSFADKMAEKYCPSTKDMTLSEYKLYIHDKINSLPLHPSQKKVFTFIDITDAAYRRMQQDPAYEQKVLNFLAESRSVNYGCCPPQFALIHIEDTWEKSYGYTYGVQKCERAKRAEERRRLEAERAKKARRKKLLKEYLKKKAEAKRLQEKLLDKQLTAQRLEHRNLMKTWDEKRRKQQAFRAYEASAVMIYRHVKDKADISAILS